MSSFSLLIISLIFVPLVILYWMSDMVYKGTRVAADVVFFKRSFLSCHEQNISH